MWPKTPLSLTIQSFMSKDEIDYLAPLEIDFCHPIGDYLITYPNSLSLMINSEDSRIKKNQSVIESFGKGMRFEGSSKKKIVDHY